MPGLVVFKRRWGIASDDLLFPALVEIVIRVTWLIAMIIIYELHYNLLYDCDTGHLLKAYLIGVMILMLIGIVLNFIIFLISMRGTIMNTEPRRHMSTVIVIHAILLFPEICWNLYGSYWSFTAHSQCPKDVIYTIKVTVICGWVLLWLLLFAIAIIFDPLGNEIYNQGSYATIPQTIHGDRQTHPRSSDWANKVWEWRLQACCCYCFQDEQRQQVFTVLGRSLASLFQDVDLVPSDIAAGLVLLHQQDKNAILHKMSVISQQPSNRQTTSEILTQENPLAWQSWMTLELANHYMKFALACYGWPAYLYGNCKGGLCQLYKNIRCCSCFRSSPNIIADNCCRCNVAALMQTASLSEEDLIYVSFHDEIYETPFYVAIDHQTCSIVVAIRGTLSIQDALTDLTIECEPICRSDLPNNLGAHKGMLTAAFFVEQRLIETHALDDAFTLYPSFDLVVTGHSLGAGTAAVLAILLRPKYPNLRCFTFSPPGALLNRETAQYSEEFILSVVVGYDIIARLNYSTLDELKKRLIRSLYACHSPKYRVLINECFDCCFGLGAQYEWSTASTPGQNNPILTDTAPGTTYESLSEIAYTSSSTRIPCMYLPGLIMHIEKQKTDIPHRNEYSVSWTEPEDFNRIIVMPQMLFEHVPLNVQKSLQEALAQQSGGPADIQRASDV